MQRTANADRSLVDSAVDRPSVLGRDCSLDDRAAINDDFGAGDETGLVACQEETGVGHLDRLTDTAHRRAVGKRRHVPGISRGS